jgi:hypothetical protein
MGPQYYLDIAKMQGYGNPANEALWANCPEDERLAILRFLMTKRAVTENCQFVEDLVVSEEEVSAMLDRMVVGWSKKTSLDEIPLTLAPFIFCAFHGTGFSLELLKREADRFLWMPDPVPKRHPTRPIASENVDFAGYHGHSDFEDSGP